LVDTTGIPVHDVEADEGSPSGEEAEFNRFDAVFEVREPSTLEKISVRSIRNTHSLAKIIIVAAFVESSVCPDEYGTKVRDVVNTIVRLKVAYV
jgi:hypothetical protein